VFSYAGAWPCALQGPGRPRCSVWIAPSPALELAVQNGERNGFTVSTRKGDAFDVLEALAQEGTRFDVVIVDPPAFAKRRKDLPKALAAYKRLNQLAMTLLSGDGILVRAHVRIM